MAGDALVEPFGAAVSPQNIDAHRLASSLHEAARQKAVEAFGPHKQEFESLELETTLWDLVAQLSGLDASTRTSPALTSLVLNWVQSNLNQPSEPANLQSIKWMYTRAQATSGTAKRSVSGSATATAATSGTTLVSELDLDAPLRQARPIADEDRAKDETLFKYVFELLLSGEYEVARMTCADTNNWLLHAALSAFTRNPQGKISDTMVQDACKALSSAPSPQLSVYEKGIYGLFSGNLAAVRPLCESWETLLLAHILCGASLEQFERSVAQDHKISLQGDDWRRKLALALINNQFESVVAQLVSDVRDPTTAATAAIIQHPWLARVVLHIQLALSEMQVDPSLVQIYVEYLCQDPALLASRLDLVPQYIRFLDSESAQASVYGHVLAQITDAEIQRRQIELANKYNIALKAAIATAIELNYDLYTSSDENSSANERLVGVLHWTVAAELWPEAAHALVRTYALLFSQARTPAIILLSSQISSEYVRARALDSVRSRVHEHPDVVADLALLKQYSLLATAMTAIHTWQQADKASASWRTSAPKLMGNIIDSVNTALQFVPPQQALRGASPAASSALVQTRSKHIPLIVYDFLDVLREAQSINQGYASVALEFAVKIADESLKLYELFDEKLMIALAEPALTLR